MAHKQQKKKENFAEIRAQLPKQQRSIYVTSDRLQEFHLPKGARHSHFYNSPLYRESTSFNFWHDLHTNVVARNNWDNSRALSHDDNLSERSHRPLSKRNNSEAVIQLMSQSPGQDQQRDLSRSSRVDRNYSQQKEKNPQKKQYMARYLYSQVDLGSDNESLHSISVENAKAQSYREDTNLVYDWRSNRNNKD